MGSFWTWLNTPPGTGEVLDPFGLFCLVLFLPGFVISAYLTGAGADRLAKEPVQRAGFRYWATIGLWVFGGGLFFFGARLMQINPLSFGEPKWLLGSVVATLAAGSRCLGWWRSQYPTALARSGREETIPPRADLGSYVRSTPAGQTIQQTTVQN
jgi:hypothetical protein